MAMNSLTATLSENIRDDGTKSPYTSLRVEINESESVYIYGSFDGFGTGGEQLDYQPSGSGWRTFLICCDVGIPTVYIWTESTDGRVLSTWTNAELEHVYLPVVAG